MSSPDQRSNARRDAGMTLVEMIVTMAVIGAIVVVLATAATVTFRQQADTEGNLGVARWEQALALWLPTDLASADPNSIDKDPASEPSGCVDCDVSSNALTLSYDDGSGPTTVSYRYGPSDDGDGYVLIRVECQASCRSQVVLRDLAEPSVADWSAGEDPPPANVIDVSGADAVDAASTPCDFDVDPTCPITVTVSVNGLPDGAGVARNSMVSVTAGGVDRDVLPTPTFDGPSFIEARSGCGGPISLVVDRSGSIDQADPEASSKVRQGVESFVRAFEGTPTRLQVVVFNHDVVTVGAPTPSGYHTYDLTEPSDVTALVGSPSSDSDGDFGDAYPDDAEGGTDWQEALARVFYTDTTLGQTFAADGNPATEIPELVVFFTDGLPNGHLATPAVDDLPAEYRYRSANGPRSQDWFRPDSWAKADSVVDTFRSSVDFVGVGIGPAFDRSVQVNRPGWPNAAWNIPNRVFLGDLINGTSNPAAFNPAIGERYSLVEYDDGWGDVSGADVLSTDDMLQLGSALAAIALAECGGTLTVQTRDAAGDPADVDVTYTLGGEQVTTSRFNKSGTFDVPFGASASATVDLVPSSLVGSPYVATGWSCASGGADLVEGTDFTLRTAGDPAQGIQLTLTPNIAVSCTLEVA